jgi:hypothetical protein
MSRVEVCDFCKQERKFEIAVESLQWSRSNSTLGLCAEHVQAVGGRPEGAPDEEPMECPECGAMSKNKRALQSHMSRHRRLKREAEMKTATLSAAE